VQTAQRGEAPSSYAAVTDNHDDDVDEVREVGDVRK